MKTIKQVVISEFKTSSNSFGDRIFEVVVEYRENGEVKDTKTFMETAYEGEHSAVKALMTKDIKTWAKSKDTRFTGWV